MIRSAARALEIFHDFISWKISKGPAADRDAYIENR